MTRMGRPRKENAKRTSLTIRLPETLHKMLHEYAVKHNLSMTEVALQSLEEFLSKNK